MDEREEKEIWESWLDKQHSEKLKQIRNAVKDIVKKNKIKYGDLPYYTPHGIKHFQAVEDLLHKLISGHRFKEFTLRERYYLLASAWLHDLGMLTYVNKIIYGKVPPHQEIRKKHHITSEKFIVEYWQEVKIDEADRELLGKLCKYHRRIEDINQCDDEFLVHGQRYRLKLLASYLRLADSLDIDSSRTPSEPYAVCLAYDIPEDSKLHWIKSKLINGIYIDADEHTITLQFGTPNLAALNNIADLKSNMCKLESIIKLVADDLRDELSSVINIITRAGISYYLDIKVRKSEICFDDQMLNDIRSLVINYDIMMAPSATRLLEIILVSLANLLGFSLQKSNDIIPFERANRKKFIDVKVKAINFLDSVYENILTSRRCHLGLINLINQCKEIIDQANDDEPVADVAQKVNEIYQDHHEARGMIRANSEKLFRHLLSDNSSSLLNILLYGYSELVSKAICGLRDFLIKKQHPGIDPKDVYNTEIEAKISRSVRIFICEGQPKTQTSYQDRLNYHDGSQYALYLRNRGFTNIIIIPDIIAGTVIDKIPIHFVLLGANGITETHFIHSAGHLGIVNLTRCGKSSNNLGQPEIILVTTCQKFFIGSVQGDSLSWSDSPELYEIDGCWFYALAECGPNRRHVWMTRDNTILRYLFDGSISFSNPREDQISINDVDYIITDKAYKRMDPERSKEIIREVFVTKHSQLKHNNRINTDGKQLGVLS